MEANLSTQVATSTGMQPRMLAAPLHKILHREASKGCMPEICAQPVALEPVYESLQGPTSTIACEATTPWIIEAPPPVEELVRLKVWISPQQKCDWLQSELFLKYLSSVGYRVTFDIVGNHEQVATYLLCHRDDLAVIRTAFAGQFELCELTTTGNSMLEDLASRAWDQMLFREFYPSLPYWHLLTCPDKYTCSPHTTLINALTCVPDPAVGVYQVVFAPVSPAHDWHWNIASLLELEYSVQLMHKWSVTSRDMQQGPVVSPKFVPESITCSSLHDKPLFAAVLRIGVLQGQEYAGTLLQSLAATTGMIQRGGRPLCHLTENDYHRLVSGVAIRDMFLNGVTHRPGFLVNSWELTSLVPTVPC